MFTDRLQRIAPACVGSGDRLVAVGVHLGLVLQRGGQWSAMSAGDFREMPISRQFASEVLDEALRANENLLPELLLSPGLSDALCDEPAIGRDRLLLGASECREEPIPSRCEDRRSETRHE